MSIKKKQFKERTESRMIKVIDNWCPCYPNNEVELTISLCQDIRDYWAYWVKIMAWSADDFGVALEYEADSGDEAEYIYNHWKNYIFDRVPNEVSIEWFYEHGFYNDS